MMGGSMSDALSVGVLTHREEVFFEQLRVYLARTRTAILAAPLAWALLAYIHGASVGYGTALVWVASVAMVDAVSLFFASRFENNLPRPERYAFWRHRQHFLHAIAGLAWGGSIFFLVRPGDVVAELVTYVFLVAVSACCVTAMSPFRSAVVLFTAGVWIPPMIAMVIAGDRMHWQFLAGTLALLGVQNLFAWLANRQLLEGIEQAVSNRRLNEALLLTRDELHRANRDLETKNRELTGLTQRLRELAMHDDLTGSYNRRYLISQIEEEIAVCARHGLAATLLMLDLDHFKKINDEYGHLPGDAVLREVTEIVQATLRDSDVFARYGGEEFVAILRMTGPDEAKALAERLRQKIAQHVFQVFPERKQLTVSIGVAEYQLGDTADGWLERADSALYQAKASGRDRVMVYAQLSLPVHSGSVISFAKRANSVGASEVADRENGTE